MLFTVKWLDSNYDERVCRSLLKENSGMVGDTSDREAVVSSAYSRNETFGTQKFKSLMKMLNSNGPNGEP